MNIRDFKPLEIDFTRVNNDINGNPRHVCHYLAFKPYQEDNEPYKSFSYEEALQMAKTLGCRKFHNKQFGGGIVFQSYNLDGLKAKILVMTGEAIYYSREPKEFESKHGNKQRKFKAFMRSDVTNRKGELKKWFYVTEYNGNKTLYSLKK